MVNEKSKATRIKEGIVFEEIKIASGPSLYVGRVFEEVKNSKGELQYRWPAEISYAESMESLEKNGLRALMPEEALSKLSALEKPEKNELSRVWDGALFWVREKGQNGVPKLFMIASYPTLFPDGSFTTGEQYVPRVERPGYKTAVDWSKEITFLGLIYLLAECRATKAANAVIGVLKEDAQPGSLLPMLRSEGCYS